MEDYALRFAPRSFRKFSEFKVANTAFGSTSFLVLEAIGGFLSVNYGFTNAVWAILAVGIIIFITSFPISYYAARYNIDIDLLTRSAGFGYIGSTITSLIYASFTFTLFALEASIMSLAIELYFKIPLAIAHVISALIVIPFVTFGITTISRLQLWSQPFWLLMLLLPYLAVAIREPEAAMTLESYLWIAGSGQGFNLLAFGSAMTIAFSMVAQIGEQVDFLRFMPELTSKNKIKWWLGTLTAGPGWILFGMLRQIGGALLAHLAIRHGIAPSHAHEPTQMYAVAYLELFDNEELALLVTTLFVIISQIKINVTNAYAGSLAWSNFFSRLTHSHPGRVIWLFFNVGIALLLMEFGVFGALEKVLGLFSNISIAWISTVAADLLINKPLRLSPKAVEFKRAYLPDLNPVGMLSTLAASVLSITAYLGGFGTYAQAFSALIALGLAFILTPLIALVYSRKRYLTRYHSHKNRAKVSECAICSNHFEQEDMAYCPFYEGNICSLCCTLDSRCNDACKPGFRMEDYLHYLSGCLFPKHLSQLTRIRLVRFALLFLFLSALTSLFIGIIYYQDFLNAKNFPLFSSLLQSNFIKVYSSMLVFIGLCAWWLILNDESRRVTQGEMVRQTQRLQLEIAEHKLTDAKLQAATHAADRANTAKSRFLSNMSHEIRTPLNSILGYAYLLNNDPSIPTHRQQAVEILKRSGEHLSALIEDILDIAKIEACKFELNNGVINFREFIQHLADTFHSQACDKRLVFRMQVLNMLPQQVKGDEKRVGQILINLLNNAVKFTQHGEVVFKVSYSCGVATFQIIDTGPGIEAEQLENIFQPFTQLGGDRLTPGSGLGLTISKILAQIMGGELSVESMPDQGSTFTVKLYLASVGGETKPLERAVITGYRGLAKKILIVEDQPDHRELLKNILAPLGFVVQEAIDGTDCIASLPEISPDLILLDLNMPGLGGYETAYQLRSQNCLVPIIVLTADAYPADRMKAINSGCNDFLAKPINISDLLAKIQLQLGLEWHYQNDLNYAKPYTEKETIKVIPSEVILKELDYFARIGDLQGLNRYLSGLGKERDASPEFYGQVEAFSKGFQLTELKKLLQHHLSDFDY